MTITQISATVTGGGQHAGYLVIGLGDDNKVYRWLQGTWQILP